MRSFSKRVDTIVNGTVIGIKFAVGKVLHPENTELEINQCNYNSKSVWEPELHPGLLEGLVLRPTVQFLKG